MIASFKHNGLRRLYQKGERQGIGANMIAWLEEILSVLEAAEAIDEANIPGFRLHERNGNRAGQWSMTATGNWRIMFRFADGAALDVDLVDYHQGERTWR